MATILNATTNRTNQMSDDVYIILPATVVKYAHIKEPDNGNPAKNIKGDGKYKLTLEYTDASVLAELKAAIEKVGGRSLAELHLPVKRLPDGIVYVKCKSNYQPTCVDERGEFMNGDEIRIYSGDTVQAQVKLVPYEGTGMTNGKPGVALQLRSVQRLAKGNGGGSNPFVGNNVLGDAEPVVIHDDTPPPQAVPSVPAPADDDSDIPF